MVRWHYLLPLAILLCLPIPSDAGGIAARDAAGFVEVDHGAGAGSGILRWAVGSVFAVFWVALIIGLVGGYMPDGSNADVSADQYHHYKEDVKLMYDMGLDAYRFSIAWPRLIPDGRGEINPKGLEYYNNLIDELIMHGIQPHVTIYHFDLPQALQDEYGGILSPRFIEDYSAYAEVCFKNFGDRVKHWATFNQPNIKPIGGFDAGDRPPRRCSYPFGTNCTGGDSSTEPYIVAHHLLLAHASAVSIYRQKYQQAIQGGQIGITLMVRWHEPYTDKTADAAAAIRMNEFHIGWFLHPLVHGDYPPVMRSRVGVRLPSITASDSEKIRGSFDFIGINHYYVIFVQSIDANEQKLRDYYIDAGVQGEDDKENIQCHSWSLGKVLNHLKLEYGNPPVMIHEMQAIQGGQIGITLMVRWHEPYTDKTADAAAAIRMNEFHIGWFLHPLVHGDYPPVMRSRVGGRLPSITASDSEKIRGSFDFIGINHYYVIFVQSIDANEQKLRDYYIDAGVQGYSDSPDIFGKINYNDDFRSEFLQGYLEALYLSVRQYNIEALEEYGKWNKQASG
ncbi:hypothetical protein OsI_32017 [Oryza sativa Indica Group]|uniref:Beta-glucosidase n=1 Tax=Oryza sativa subsp. indica TaxID=39946 RepID=B8BDI0_ORYSI|nr:hypothetical protein OsI_32017 [Oryza sativa Indica Group]